MISSNPSQEFTRSAVKQILMPKSYGLTNHGMSTRIKEAYPKIKGEELKMVIKIYKSCWLKRFSSIETIFKVFSEIGKMVASLNTPLIVSIHPRLAMWQQYHPYTIIKSRIPLKKRGEDTPLDLDQTRDRTVNIRVYDKERGDLAKSGNSTAANITHMIDGLICTEVMRLFFQAHPKEVTPLFTNHDCFYTTLDRIEEICPIYNRAVVTILSGEAVGECFPTAPGMKPVPLIDRIVFPSLHQAMSISGVREMDIVQIILASIALRKKEALLFLEEEIGILPTLPKRVQEGIRAYIDYREMIAEREDLLPQVLESKVSLFP